MRFHTGDHRPDYAPPTVADPQFLDVDRIRLPLLGGWIAVVILQALFWFDLDTFFSSVLAIAGGIIGISYSLRKYALLEFPISTLMVLGYTCSYFLLPPITTLIELKSITTNLENPVLVFVHAVVCLLALILAHMLYRFMPGLQAIRKMVVESLYRPLGYFSVPTITQVFVMGAIGLGAMVLQLSSGPAMQGEDAGVVAKLMQGLYPLAYLPYCLLIAPLVGIADRFDRRWAYLLVPYTVVLITVSAGRNSRAAFLIGIASILIAYGYGVVTQRFRKPRFRPSTLAALALGLFMLTGPLTDFATAMVAAREQRGDVGAATLVSETFRLAQDKEALKSYRIQSAVANAEWDELYVDNLFLARLSNLKFADQSIGLANSLDSGGRSYLRDMELQRALSALPLPVIEFLGLAVDKLHVTSGSGGDLMLFTVTGSQYAMGGFRTGSIFGSGYGMFGWFYPVVLMILAMLIYSLADASTIKRRSAIRPHAISDLPQFNVITAALLFAWFFYFTSAANGVESVSGLAQFLFRGWIQVLLIYLFAYWVSFLLVRSSELFRR